MSKRTVRGADDTSLTEEAVADYLQGNLDFFERHATLLARLKLSHSRGSVAVSLIERQVLVLREKNEKLELRLRELIDVARSNDVLAGKIHRLAKRLLRIRDAAHLIEVLEFSLREDFGASDWLVLLAPPKHSEFHQVASRHVRIIDPTAPELKMFETLFESGRPRCGQIRDAQRDFLFAADTLAIGSAALVPFGTQPSTGLLAIGSPDAERFHAAMSVDFLAQLGELISEALAGR